MANLKRNRHPAPETVDNANTTHWGEVGETLRKMRGYAGLTQVETAEAAGMPQSQLARIERGAVASLDSVTRIAAACGWQTFLRFQQSRYTRQVRIDTAGVQR